MTPDDIARFLKAHPQFFDTHPELLDGVQVTHPYGGRAIPLAERQIIGLRDRVRQLEAKLTELLRFGAENDALSEKVHRLAVALAGARDFPGLSQVLYLHLREDFAVPHVALRIWGAAVPAACAEAAAVDAASRRTLDALTGPHCGPAAGNPCLGWFGDAAAHVHSLALVPIGSAPALGLLALGSEEAKRFFPEMGTLYLRRIGELCAAGIAARL